ncbi:hypothetical protein BDZ97DRAFT_1762293 [Flammula alnicola]|nr:hypothetical protein BDZ97DRAFT_1762293 [Flammula alnicola]
MDAVNFTLEGFTATAKRKIEDYFGASSSSNTRQNSPGTSNAVGVTPTLSPARVASSESAPKKFKITAGNGRDVVWRQPQKKKVKREQTHEDLSMSDDGEEGSSSSLRRTNSRAKLGLLPSLPLDVLFEIFSHLMPVDILYLSRTTKELRRLLLHRSATFVWKAALENVPELPACPEDLSLPFWTNLVFDSHCQNCLTNNVKSINFLLRVRYCNKCIKIKLTSESTYERENKLHDIILKAVPFSHWNDRRDRYCTIDDKDAFIIALDAVEGDRSAFVEKRREEIKARRLHAKECKKWLKNVTLVREAELEEIRAGREFDIRQKLSVMGYDEELAFLDKMNRGVCAIQPWPGIVMLHSHPDIKQPKPLTERMWSNIEKDMVRYMRRARKLLEQDKHLLVLRKRRIMVHNAYISWRTRGPNLLKYPPDTLMPGPADILEFAVIERLLNTPDETDLKLQSDIVPFLEHHIQPAIETWRLNTLRSLWVRAADSRVCAELEWSIWCPLSTMQANLALAVVVFRCARGVHWVYDEKRIKDDALFPAGTSPRDARDERAPCMWFPEFLFHPCNAVKRYSFDEDRAGEHKNLDVHGEYAWCRRDRWTMEFLPFDAKASRATRNILDACGMDYASTTTAELDGRDPRLACLKCTFGARCDGQRKVRVWAWRDAVQHCLKAHFGDARVTWECLSPPDTAEAKRLEAIECAKRNYLTPQNQKIWKCMRCRDTQSDVGRITWAALQGHFRSNPKHGNADAMEGKEGILYYKALDCAPRELPPVKMIPGKPATNTA